MVFCSFFLSPGSIIFSPFQAEYFVNGKLTWPTVRPLVKGIVTVSDNEIRDTMRFLFERMKLVVEPSGASALAALMTGKVDGRGKRVGVTISGGNIGLDGYCQIINNRDPE